MKEIPLRSDLGELALVAEVGSYTVSASSAGGFVVVSTDSYHPELLVLTRDDLRSLLGFLEGG